MISEITQIGKLLWEQKGYSDTPEDLLRVFTEDPSAKGRYNKVMVIQMEESLGKMEYIDVNIMEYDKRDELKLMYKPGSSRGTDLSPTAKLTEPERTFQNKILKRIEDISQYKRDETYQNEQDTVREMTMVLKENQNRIIDRMDEIYKKKDKDDLFIVTISLKKDGCTKYPGDFPTFQKAFVDDSLKSMYYRTTGNLDTRIDNGICSVCLGKELETYGLASPFTFYTIDKPGYIAGGFNYNAIPWNYPVCRQCAIWLMMGKEYLDHYLRFSAFGKTFYLIPNPFEENRLPQMLNQFIKLNDVDTFAAFREEYLNREDKLFKYLGKTEDVCTMSFLFFEEDNSSFRILLELQDILPSRLSRIFDELERVNGLNFFNSFPIGSEREMSIFINFKWLSDVFDSDTSKKYFLEAFGNIVEDKKIDYHFLMSFIARDLYSEFGKEDSGNFRLFTIASYGFLSFLVNLNIINDHGRRERLTMNLPEKNRYRTSDYENKRDMFEDFFEDHRGFFNTPEKKSVFMIGFLSRKLLNIQSRRPGGGTPFRARLKGLKLMERDIKRLFHEIINKLEEYDSNYYKSEEGLCAEYFVEAGTDWDMSPEDISFYTALGMNMTHCFIYDNREEKRDEDSE